MDPASQFRREVNMLTRLTGVRPSRPIPESVREVGEPAEIHLHSSVRGNELLVSSELASIIDLVLKKEAFSLFIPPEADRIPQVHGLAWYYAGASRELWSRFREMPSRPFEHYDLYDDLIPWGVDVHALARILLAVRASAWSGELTLPIFTSLVRRQAQRSIEFKEAYFSILEAISRSPTADVKELERRTGMNYQRVWKVLKVLRERGIVFGPENVNLDMLGLETIVVSFPNRRELREAFWRFPFTYNQLIPLHSEARVYSLLLIPYEKVESTIRALSSLGLETGKISLLSQSFRLRGGEEGFLDEMLRSAHDGKYRFEVPLSPRDRPPTELTKDDLRILNLVLLKGSVSARIASEAGIRSPKRRLRKLRESGLIGKYYLAESPPGHSTVVVRVRGGREFMGRVYSVVRTATTAQLTLISSPSGDEYILGTMHVEPKDVSSFLLGVRLSIGEKLAFAGEAYDVVTKWTLPVDLWDEEEQTFRIDDTLEDLVWRIGRLLGRA